MNTVMDSIKQDAANLITWLRLPGVGERYGIPAEQVGILWQLVNSCTPEEAEAQIEKEIAEIERIIRGAA